MAGLTEPLLGGSEYCDKSLSNCPITKYVEAGVLSRMTFFWLRSLFQTGAQRILQKDDVPILGPDDRASFLYQRFSESWPQEPGPNSVRQTLFKAFWGPFIVCGVWGLFRVLLMYVGPLLIQSFVNATAGNTRFEYEGQVLVVVLLVSQLALSVVSHQYQFCCNRLGMQVRSCLITSLFRKGLRLSSSGRQSHGVGQIVNYMSVDAKTLAEAVLQLHNAWMLPMQIIVAIAILVNVVQLATVAGLVVMVTAVSITLVIASQQRVIQGNLMKGKDLRMKITNEALANMKVIKLQAYENRFLELVQAARSSEYGQLIWRMSLTAVNIFILWLTPLISSVAIFAACVFLGIKLTAAAAFTTIATVRLMQEAMRTFPMSLIAMSTALISLDRIERFMLSEELEEGAVEKLPSDASDDAISVEGGTFKWDPTSDFTILSNINLSIKKGFLVTVVGRVGSGKSSLLSCLLGEMSKVTGGEVPKVTAAVKICGTTAYVSQSPWILNATIQENILFGQEMDFRRYKETLQICQLDQDLAQLEFGDDTEIGERGINLSGGQKQRIQLARAIYQDCDIYLLDDIFSAVDAHTGSKLFTECILAKLKAKKTVMLVTHQVDFLHKSDHVLVMHEGAIVQSGVYSEIMVPGTELASLVEAYGTALEKGNMEDDFLVEQHSERSSWPLVFSHLNEQDAKSNAPEDSLKRQGSRSKWDDVSAAFAAESVKMKPNLRPNGKEGSDNSLAAGARLIGEEERATGRVSVGVYWLYVTKVSGGALIVFLLVVQILWQLLQIAGDYWLAYTTGNGDQSDSQSRRFISVYAGLAVACGFFVLVRSTLVSYAGLKTCQHFYRDMLHSIFRAPLSFFDTTPTGRILSRASTDQSAVDADVPLAFGSLLAMVFSALGIGAVTLTVTWQVGIIVVPLMWAYYSYQKYYITTARELTRIDGLTKAPIIHHFSETIAGFITIRSYEQQGRFIRGNLDRVDNNLRMDFHNNAASEWMAVRTETIGCIVICASALILVSLPPDFVQPELVGLCLSYGLSLNICLYAVVWLLCYLENNMVSVERIRQFSDLPAEAPLHIEDTKPPAEWPITGTIIFRHLQLRYRSNTPLVLKDISFTVQGGHKVGVVGRTGSGKSTLTLALFRLVEPAGGSIFIDGIDISSLGLHDLRKKLSIIPQEPTLFDGTVRTNLDFLGLHSDDEIWECLRKCQLMNIVRQLDGKLDSPVLENGENWSVGQRQLFCLGRALLRRSKILVLDEATASVDAQSDSLIQKTVREECCGCTVVSIAHRIPTVMDSDKVLVLDAGRVTEYDRPSSLMNQPTSLFSALVREYAARANSEDK